MFGFYETLVEYYTGRDASQMTDAALVRKIAHIAKIRQLEADQALGGVLESLIHGR